MTTKVPWANAPAYSLLHACFSRRNGVRVKPHYLSLRRAGRSVRLLAPPAPAFGSQALREPPRSGPPGFPAAPRSAIHRGGGGGGGGCTHGGGPAPTQRRLEKGGKMAPSRDRLLHFGFKATVSERGRELGGQDDVGASSGRRASDSTRAGDCKLKARPGSAWVGACRGVFGAAGRVPAWNVLALDGSNWQRIDLFDFQRDIESLSHCELITDDGIRHLGNGACAHDQLEVIELDNCPLITDASLEHLKSCHSLERIELYDCQQITRAGIKRLRTHLPNIKVHAYFAPVTPPPSVGGSRQRFCRCCIIL
ncbi:F-box/LRR-repeat protein 20 [Cricetulus griseus]|uniref:F-box/LRR-repeat protein 20 n=1 Tax=Cricetulus griseus TaxID=10029 RepID=G3H5X0_CRIGR|nr:F-box/LRR-repeat protein 20 [Cricetulus griseus]